MNHLSSWIDSTAWQDTSSGGPSPKGSIEPWNPVSFNQAELSYGGRCVAYAVAAVGTTYNISISIQGCGETDAKRLLGTFIVWALPEEGLDEALHSLRDMLEFYKKQPIQPLMALPRHNVIEGVLVDRKKRPGLIITD